jgi:hypothetical protein
MLQAGRPSSSPDVTDFFFPIYLILPAALDPGDHSATNRNEYQKIFLVSKVRPARKADNREPIV